MNRPNPRPAEGSRGFTLVELLTVIAIIAVLSAILLPVLASARRKARQSSCMSNMKAILQGLLIYREDNRVHPDALYGISYDGVTLQPRLYPNYVKDQSVFTCPESPVKRSSPPQLADAVNPITSQTFRLAAFSSYDFQYRTQSTLELHYTRKWTPPAATGLSDDPRQLYYRNPPDSTVVTWCMYHAGLDRASGMPSKNHMALVAFLSGRVQEIPAEKLAAWPGPDGKYPWQVAPKP